MKKPLVGFLGLVVVLLSIMLVRAARMAPPDQAAGEPIPSLRVDAQAAAARLAGAIRYPTVSWNSGAPVDTATFLAFHDYLTASFPRVHAALQRELVGSLSLLYTWPGTDPALEPLVLMGHLDVVPVPEESAGQWTRDPFGGLIEEGYVWGRGALDDKATVLAVLEAVEALLAEGWQPRRTVYLAFGHDEEVGGVFGAKVMVDTLVARGVRPALVVDEGGFVSEGMMPGFPPVTAIVGVAEKGYLSLELMVEAEGGHSSVPPGETAVGILSRAIGRLQAEPFPARMNPVVRGMLENLAAHGSFGTRFVLGNLWITGPLVNRTLGGTPTGSAMLRTTTAPTMLRAGVKDNVLPPRATGVVNFRIVPGETVASVIDRVRRIIDDERVRVEPLSGVGQDPSNVSAMTGPAWEVLASTISQSLPDPGTPVIPYLVFGGTDAKFWSAHSDRVYRFLPITLTQESLGRFHGVDERVAVESFATAVGFFGRLLRASDRLP